METHKVVVPWHRDAEREAFLAAWGLKEIPDYLLLQQDKHHEGCGVTKNRGVQRAIEGGAEVVIILDGDCYPHGNMTLSELVGYHLEALQPQLVELYSTVTDPPSRGTPYTETTIQMPVAASLGFWSEIGDYCAVRQLAYRGTPMVFDKRPIFGRYFSLCGMNIAFRPRDWLPWCQFIDVARFDDIWMGWLWQREAYRRGFCFNLGGPLVRHSRQSNVWSNLRAEALHLEESETLWRKIAQHPRGDYEVLRALLPV